ncbi:MULTISPECIES: hypothetical protein [unclassified Streptomyces]|uniref:hypothetical protein n=1 Tax=unclassified Streptomyces TaxID=2593676 RepID=UPI003247FE03
MATGDDPGFVDGEGWVPADSVELANDVAARADSDAEHRPLSDEEFDAATTRHRVLVGHVAQASAIVELNLRRLMTALLDSKYAGLVSAGLSMSDLIETCLILTKVNQEIKEDQRTEIRETLSALKPAIVTRNHLVHGLWYPFAEKTGEIEEDPLALVSKRRAGDKVVVISYDAAEELAKTLTDLGMRLFRWTFDVLPAQARREQVYP